MHDLGDEAALALVAEGNADVGDEAAGERKEGHGNFETRRRGKF
jgi:hypothetical protein